MKEVSFSQLIRTLLCEADRPRHSQTEATEVLESSVDYHENTISKIRRSRCQLTGYEEISG